MSFTLYDACVPPLADMLENMAVWIDKAQDAGVDEAALMQARLAPDMHPFPRQYQMASDGAKSGAAKLAGATAPSMPDTEASLAELRTRVTRTADFVRGLDRAAFDDAGDRRIDITFPNGMAFGANGAQYLTTFVLPNLHFHASIAYALLRENGVPLGKADLLRHAAPFFRPAG